MCFFARVHVHLWACLCTVVPDRPIYLLSLCHLHHILLPFRNRRTCSIAQLAKLSAPFWDAHGADILKPAGGRNALRLMSNSVHPSLCAQEHFEGNVLGIVDHHVDESAHPEAKERLISEVQSCSPPQSPIPGLPMPLPMCPSSSNPPFPFYLRPCSEYNLHLARSNSKPPPIASPTPAPEPLAQIKNTCYHMNPQVRSYQSCSQQ